MVSVQPTASTSVRFVCSATQPPALLVTDGPTSVLFGPGPGTPGLSQAAEFAERLRVQVEQWADACAQVSAAPGVRPYVDGSLR
jgi:hypothetical protein